MAERFAFTTTFYDDDLTSYKYRSVPAEYKPVGMIERGNHHTYEEIATTQQEVNDLIDELENDKIYK